MTVTVKITRAPADPMCTRVSVGGNRRLGYYCVYRGSLDDSILALEIALVALREMKEEGTEPPIVAVPQIGVPGKS